MTFSALLIRSSFRHNTIVLKMYACIVRLRLRPRVQNTQEGHYYDYVIHVNYAYLWCKKSKTSNFKEESDIG